MDTKHSTPVFGMYAASLTEKQELQDVEGGEKREDAVRVGPESNFERRWTVDGDGDTRNTALFMQTAAGRQATHRAQMKQKRC